MRQRIKKINQSMAFLFQLPSRLFLILIVLLRKTLPIAMKKIGIIAWGVSVKVS